MSFRKNGDLIKNVSKLHLALHGSILVTKKALMVWYPFHLFAKCLQLIKILIIF